MNQMDYVIIAYAVAVPCVAWLTISSLIAMRRAERAVDALIRQKDNRA